MEKRTKQINTEKPEVRGYSSDKPKPKLTKASIQKPPAPKKK